MKVHKLVTGPVQANCYILEKEGTALIIDPGDDYQRIIDKVTQLKVQPLSILLTHGHFDHIGAVDQVRHHFSISVYIHELEADFLTDPNLNLSTLTGQPTSLSEADQFFAEEGSMTTGPFTYDLLHIPGHSPGSVGFFFEEDKLLIAGDTLFKGSVGRTDFPNADANTLLASIQHKLLTLDDNVTVYPGHGPATRIQDEKINNPFLKF